jgi:hypothetical protein
VKVKPFSKRRIADALAHGLIIICFVQLFSRDLSRHMQKTRCAGCFRFNVIQGDHVNAKESLQERARTAHHSLEAVLSVHPAYSKEIQIPLTARTSCKLQQTMPFSWDSDAMILVNCLKKASTPLVALLQIGSRHARNASLRALFATLNIHSIQHGARKKLASGRHTLLNTQ